MPTVDKIDRPPAGTACVFCRDDAKHFCPATGYVSETSDDGICDACRCGEPCEVRRRIQALADPFLDMPADPVPEPSRSVPREEWTEADRMKQSTTEIEDLMSRAKGRGIAIPETIRARILAEPVTESNMALERKYGLSNVTVGKIRRAAGIITPGMQTGPGRPAFNRISDEVRDAVLAEPDTETNFDVATRHGISAASVLNIRRDAGRPIPPPRSPRIQRTPYKAPQREVAGDLLRAGWSTREIAAKVGLSRNKVVEVKRQIPDLPARSSPGGAPEHRGKRLSNVIDPKVRAAIIAADPSISHGALARLHGISGPTVSAIRRGAGIKRVEPHRGEMKSQTTNAGQRATEMLRFIAPSPTLPPTPGEWRSSLYHDVLDDLRMKRSLIDNAITALEQIVGDPTSSQASVRQNPASLK